MKSIIYCLILLIFVQSSCRQHTTSSPPEFTGYKNNPILKPGKPGSWDELFVISPQVIHYENVFFLFYMGCNESGRMAVGIATSRDGFNFLKFEGNPVLAPDSAGYDAFTVGPGIILKEDTSWVMFYNCQELAGYSPGSNVVRATARQLTGPWIKNDSPVLTTGSKGEWDDGFIIPSSVVRLENGMYRMYYSGGREITLWDKFYIGMATSMDGISWKKYNDPATERPPYAESDPVFMTGETGKWDVNSVWMANVTKSPTMFTMYYTGCKKGNREAIGYTESKDGIDWERYHGNPVYETEDDPFSKKTDAHLILENPFVLILDTISFLYYDHGTPPGTIGVATVCVH